MESNSPTNPDYLHVQNTQVIAPSTPVGPSAEGTASMFSNSVNPRFKDCTFNAISTVNGVVSGLNILYQNVAPNAILNAGGRADEVRCHPGTREEVIGLIDKWRRKCCNNPTVANRMFWLTGPAGAGKTAIVQTVTENWKALDLPIANFFFFRTDPSRSHPRSLVSTLLYQIFDFYPAVRDIVEKTLTSKPRLLEASIAEQFDQLICAPFRSIGPQSFQPIVLLIDGLDECDWAEKTSQRHILQALDKLVGQKDLPFLVFVASRREPHISMAFKVLTSQVSSIFLDDQYSPAKDIRTFVKAEFEKIKAVHIHATLLDSNWPPDSDIAEIVRKSSGQFVYAATVMHFLAQSSAVPSHNLEIIQGIVPPATNSPFAYLDSFYTHILKQADDCRAIRDILSAKLFNAHVAVIRISPKFNPIFTCSMLPIFDLLRLYNSRYTTAHIVSCISALVSLIQLNDNKQLVFYHASLADFLMDRARSNMFHVDLDEFTATVFPEIWKQGVKTVYFTSPPMDEARHDVPLGCVILRQVQQISPVITDALICTHPSNFNSFCHDMDLWITRFLRDICRLYESRDKKSYRKIVKAWITWAVDVDEHGMHELESEWHYPNYGNLPDPTIIWYLRIARVSKSLHGLPKILALAQIYAHHSWEHVVVVMYQQLFRFRLNCFLATIMVQFFVYYFPFEVLLFVALLNWLNL